MKKYIVEENNNFSNNNLNNKNNDFEAWSAQYRNENTQFKRIFQSWNLNH